MFDQRSSALHPIWMHPDYVAQLQRMAAIHFSLFREGKSSRRPTGNYFKALWDFVVANFEEKLLPSDDIGDQPIERFMRFETSSMADARLYDMLAYFCFRKLSELSQNSAHANLGVHLKGCTAILAFQAYENQNPQTSQIARSLIATKGIHGNNYLKIPHEYFANAAQYLTRTKFAAGDDERVRKSAYYFCYRYSSKLGSIAKSVLQILPPTADDQTCRFINRLRLDDGTIRDASGFLWRVNDCIYFVGLAGQNHALKSVVVSAYSAEPPRIIRGLVLSHTRSPLVGRLAMVAVSEQMSRKPMEGIGQFDKFIRTEDELLDQEFSSDDFRKTIVPVIRNKLDFRAGFKFYIADDSSRRKFREIKQSDMVALVGEALRKYYFYGYSENDIKPFNPADHEHYTFNQAIKAD